MLGWFWWVLALALVSAEMLGGGTFYLLALAMAAAIGGVVELLGASFPWQLFSVGASGTIGCLGAYFWRKKTGRKPGKQMAFDVGQRVRVLNWNDDGSARVSYRGSWWDAIVATPDTPRRDSMVIVEVRGSVLVLGENPMSAPH
ncbi:MAG: NfeD family protein [Burkholderiales bacterium]|jgi:membrane protein implicated in regulation of membrane protease activity|nr:NfeD family protein [Burkholderiales bacterium]